MLYPNKNTSHSGVFFQPEPKQQTINKRFIFIRKSTHFFALTQVLKP